ncbi:unnamed protein product [Rhizophagus irregularis]|nr:unnamed protein product [Rhizophagus irregularis]
MVLREEEHYKFPIPSISPMIQPGVVTTIYNPVLPVKRDPGNVLTSTLDTHLPTNDTLPTPFKEGHSWSDKLGILIPTDLIPYVTEEPVYVSKRQEKLKGKQHEPGSKGWLDFFMPVKIIKKVWMLSSYMKMGVSSRAKLWGTSANSIEYREGMIKRGKSVYKTNQQLIKLEKELAQFKIDYFSVMDDNESHYHYKGHTSDDTKKLELRPNKRTVPSSTGTSRSHDHIKKIRSDSLIKEDYADKV